MTDSCKVLHRKNENMKMFVKKNTLVANTFFLYVLTFSNYIFAFLTIPYQTRILGPEVFGIIGFCLAFYTYFMLLFDFGFILSGTKIVVDNKNNRFKLCQVFSSITFFKILLFVLISLTFGVLCFFVELLRERWLIMLLYMFLAFLTALIPDYLYRGLENMKSITLRTVCVRLLFCLLIFVFLKKPSQYWMIPLFQILGTFAALIWVYYDLQKTYNISFVRVDMSFIIKLTMNSFQFFFSRIASTIYSVTNTVILGFIYPTGNLVGLYSSADKFRIMAGQACSPIADSFYPYMIRTKNFRIMNRVVGIAEVFIMIACVFFYLYSADICSFVFGHEYAGAASYLNLLLPICAIVLPLYMYGFPALTAIGKQQWANYSVELAMLLQLFGILFLVVTQSLNAINLCYLTILSEYSCLLIRLYVFFRNYKKTIKLSL